MRLPTWGFSRRSGEQSVKLEALLERQWVFPRTPIHEPMSDKSLLLSQTVETRTDSSLQQKAGSERDVTCEAQPTSRLRPSRERTFKFLWFEQMKTQSMTIPLKRASLDQYTVLCALWVSAPLASFMNSYLHKTIREMHRCPGLITTWIFGDA